MSARLRWLAVSVVGLVALIAVFSFSPRTVPAAPPPVRLEGSVESTTGPTGSELVVVPAPSIDIRVTPTTTPPPSVTITTLPAPITTSPSSEEVVDQTDDSAGSDDGGEGDGAEDSAASADASADSPDD